MTRHGSPRHDAPPAHETRLERDALRIAIGVLAGSPPPEEALARVAAAALAGTGADLAVVVERGIEGILRVRTSAGEQAIMPGTRVAALPGGALERAMNGRVAHAATVPGQPEIMEAAVPIVVDGRNAGALVVSGPRLADGTEERLLAFGQLLSMVLVRVEDRRRLSALASTDPLTGLGNRRHFDERFHVAVEQAQRHHQPLSLALLDVDHFKRINDEHGHQRGDDALAEVARRLAATCRIGESVARIGGEEFAWILPLTSGDGAEAAARRARAAVREEPFARVGRLTVSIGISELSLASDASDLVRRADRALYRAKAAGRDRIVRDIGEEAVTR
ncbi:MAG: GGDEF domain-containing protein [Thermoleophilia bacterium]